MRDTPLRGVVPVAPTPFMPAGELDLDGQRRVLDCMIDQSVDGILTVMAEGREASAEDWNGALYRPEPPFSTARRLTAIPYYLWSNREPGRMLVWIPEC